MNATSMPPEAGLRNATTERIPRIPRRARGARPAMEGGAVHACAKITSVAIALGLAVVGSVAVMVSASGLETTASAAPNVVGAPLVAPPSPDVAGVALAKPAAEGAATVTTCVMWADGTVPPPAPSPPAAVEIARGRATSPAPAAPLHLLRPAFDSW